MSEAFERVIDALDAHGSKSSNRRQHQAVYQCPAHDDGRPSLSITDKGDRVMIHCFANCHSEDIVKSLGLELRDLFDGELDRFENRGQLIRSYLYERANGEPWFYVDRFYPKTFRQRLPDVEPVRDLNDREEAARLGLRGRAPIIYHAPAVHRAIRKGGARIWWLDGEKDVETAERHGLVATCPPGFRKWDPKYAEFLRGAEEIVMVVDQDKEKPNGTLGAGQSNAVTARQGFRSVGLRVRVVAPAFGKDLTDHFDADYGEDDFVPEPSIYTRPRGMKADDLMVQEFEPVEFAVHGILPSGLTIFAGSPKAGKSWVALDLCLAVAAGGPALSEIATTQGSSLYLAREDTYRRLQSRIALLMGGDMSAVPKGLELVPAEQEWVGGEEGLANMTEWAEEVRNPRLVVLDTLAKVEPEMGEGSRNTGAYAGNYTMMSRYKQWADQHNCAVLVVHHDRKAAAGSKEATGMEGDPFSRISGTRGLTGAADTLWFLETVRGKREGALHVTGRDVAEQTIELMKMGPMWQAMYGPEEAH